MPPTTPRALSEQPPRQSMPDPAREAAGAGLVSPLVFRALLAALAALFVLKALHFFGVGQIHADKKLVDFDAFHVAAQLVWRGEIADAYSYARMSVLERQIGGGDGFLPWTYPPPFNLVLAPLGLLPLGVAYVLFVGATAAAYLLVLRRIAGAHLPLVLMAILPVLVVNLSCGQNGFLSGALLGAAALLLMAQKSLAGIPVGLMVIKPHMAVPFALLAFGRWRFAGVALGLALALCLAATAAFGPGIWAAFLGGVSEASTFLAEGQYLLFRMISAYATVRSFGLPAGVALAAQIISAALALGLVAQALASGRPLREALGLAALAAPFISPYAYDYDLTIFGIGLALLMPALAARASRAELIRLTVLSAIASGTGMATNTQHELVFGRGPVDPSQLPPSLSFLLLAPLVGLIWTTLRRAPRG